MRRLDDLLLTGVGVLAVHQAAYTVSAALGFESSIAHGHMAIAWLVGSLLALVGLGLAVTRSLRQRSHAIGSPHVLISSMLVGYTLMEAVERTYDGVGAFSLPTEPVFWLGVGLTPLVALVLRWSLGSAERIAELFVGGLRTRGSWPDPIIPVLGATEVVLAPLPSSSVAVSRRGPPVRLPF